MSNQFSPRIKRALAELEFDLWEAVMLNEMEPNTDIKFDFTVRRSGTGSGPYEETVEVTVAMRRRPHASD
jgi:hypothetical protein